MEAGDMLDRMIKIGDYIHGYRVLEPILIDPDLTTAYNGDEHSIECPVCSSFDTCVVKHEGKRMWWCSNCWLAWESVFMGYAKDFGNLFEEEKQ